jgi:hypothetical protein
MQNPELARASLAAFDQLAIKTVRQGSDSTRDPGPIAAWSLVHGLSMLLINEKLRPERRDQVSDILKLLEAGIAAHIAGRSR